MFVEMALHEAESLFEQGKSEGPVNKDRLGKLKVFIDKEPEMILYSFLIEKGKLAGKRIYIGGNK